MEFIKHYFTVAALFVVIDAIWIKSIANGFYKAQMRELLRKKPQFVPAIIFYVVYMLGLVVFVVDPALAKHSLSYALGHGALLGILMYATYDLTNQSTLKNWPAKVTMVDMTWGTTITTGVSVLTFMIFR